MRSDVPHWIVDPSTINTSLQRALAPFGDERPHPPSPVARGVAMPAYLNPLRDARGIQIPPNLVPLREASMCVTPPVARGIQAPPPLAPGYAVQAMYPPSKIVYVSQTVQNVAPASNTNTGTETIITTPLSTWIIPHTLGRRPNVTIYDSTGDEVITDVHSTNTSVTVIFANPTTGSAVLS